MAGEYYCRECANQRGKIPDPPTGKVVRTKKQRGKHHKHTTLNPNEEILGIFPDLSTDSYRKLVLETWENGDIEIGDNGKTNIVWASGEKVGDVYRYGALQGPAEVIKVVLASDPESVHSYPVSRSDYDGRKCLVCRKPFPERKN